MSMGSERPMLKPIITDRFGRQVFPKLRTRIMTYAGVLARLGFRQARAKPHVFYWKVREGTIFADLGGTDVIPIWEDPSVYIYWKFNPGVPFWRQRQLVLKC